MSDFNLDQYIKNAETIVREARLKTLKRWGQEKCECGEKLETLTDETGHRHIRICFKCEEAANNRDYGEKS